MNKKSILVLIGLFGLIGWAIYDNFFSEQVSNSNIQVEQEKEEKEDTDLNDKTGLETGDKAPDFQLQTFTGEELSLSGLQGKKVVLNFWASWCPPCKAEMPHMQNFYVRNQDQNVEILGVNMTTAEKNEMDIGMFIKDYGLTFPIVLDSKGDVSILYQAISIPTTYFIDSDGYIQHKVMGPMDQEMLEELVHGMD
ncbi:redoxin domain-containing protein [Bacillus sp. AGMB 02131]|uniref:Redoxin domain-containing protein n=1 Tax=Peribacillus faecalis TaxID=2772559 RepID=A0A927CVV9_9BACI|nr:redoxin domain-containing protein [Peribacillus faecalis]MBD3108026.1 redoxin domain-containing protein [Peribacillus faecalis]